jgi:SAM-dependent methyltransferase
LPSEGLVARTTRELRRLVRRAFRPFIFIRVRPYSTRYGTDRGTPLDRVYIERFIDQHAAAVHGDVLEVNDDRYTVQFGRDYRSHVVDIRRTNPHATLIADLCEPGSLPREHFDCVILTHTIQLVEDPAAALANIHASLVPGGVALITVPSLSRLDLGDRDYWRWVPSGLEALCQRAMPGTDVEVQAYGNAGAGAAFFVGLSAENVGRRILNRDDPNFPVVTCARVTKP